jgi:catechol 2,3-dioxygenase-like lactoylglutathione lyase family enzyme
MLRVRNACLILVCAATRSALAAPPPAPAVACNFDRLASALTLLNDADRKMVDQAVELIREGEHAGALARLSTLTHSNPDNSSLRILMAYAQLQLGNLTGAFDEAKKAHDAPNGNSYRCYFLAKIAFLTGDNVTCRRELNHAKNAGDMPEEVRQLQKRSEEGQSQELNPILLQSPYVQRIGAHRHRFSRPARAGRVVRRASRVRHQLRVRRQLLRARGERQHAGDHSGQRSAAPPQFDDPGIRHLAIDVDDFDAAHERLQAAGVRFLGEPMNKQGNRLLFFADHDGNILHLIQRERPLP